MTIGVFLFIFGLGLALTILQIAAMANSPIVGDGRGVKITLYMTLLGLTGTFGTLVMDYFNG